MTHLGIHSFDIADERIVSVSQKTVAFNFYMYFTGCDSIF